MEHVVSTGRHPFRDPSIGGASDPIFALDKLWRSLSALEQRVASTIVTYCVEHADMLATEQQQHSFRYSVQQWRSQCELIQQAQLLRQDVLGLTRRKGKENAASASPSEWGRRRTRPRAVTLNLTSLSSGTPASSFLPIPLPAFPILPSRAPVCVAAFTLLVDIPAIVAARSPWPATANLAITVAGRQWVIGAISLSDATFTPHTDSTHTCVGSTQSARVFACAGCWAAAELHRPPAALKSWSFVCECAGASACPVLACEDAARMRDCAGRPAAAVDSSTGSEETVMDAYPLLRVTAPRTDSILLHRVPALSVAETRRRRAELDRSLRVEEDRERVRALWGVEDVGQWEGPWGEGWEEGADRIPTWLTGAHAADNQSTTGNVTGSMDASVRSAGNAHSYASAVTSSTPSPAHPPAPPVLPATTGTAIATVPKAPSPPATHSVSARRSRRPAPRRLSIATPVSLPLPPPPGPPVPLPPTRTKHHTFSAVFAAATLAPTRTGTVPLPPHCRVFDANATTYAQSCSSSFSPATVHRPVPLPPPSRIGASAPVAPLSTMHSPSAAARVVPLPSVPSRDGMSASPRHAPTSSSEPPQARAVASHTRSSPSTAADSATVLVYSPGASLPLLTAPPSSTSHTSAPSVLAPNFSGDSHGGPATVLAHADELPTTSSPVTPQRVRTTLSSSPSPRSLPSPSLANLAFPAGDTEYAASSYAADAPWTDADAGSWLWQRPPSATLTPTSTSLTTLVLPVSSSTLSRTPSPAPPPPSRSPTQPRPMRSHSVIATGLSLCAVPSPRAHMFMPRSLSALPSPSSSPRPSPTHTTADVNTPNCAPTRSPTHRSLVPFAPQTHTATPHPTDAQITHARTRIHTHTPPYPCAPPALHTPAPPASLPALAPTLALSNAPPSPPPPSPHGCLPCLPAPAPASICRRSPSALAVPPRNTLRTPSPRRTASAVRPHSVTTTTTAARASPLPSRRRNQRASPTSPLASPPRMRPPPAPSPSSPGGGYLTLARAVLRQSAAYAYHRHCVPDAHSSPVHSPTRLASPVRPQATALALCASTRASPRLPLSTNVAMGLESSVVPLPRALSLARAAYAGTHVYASERDKGSPTLAAAKPGEENEEGACPPSLSRHYTIATADDMCVQLAGATGVPATEVTVLERGTRTHIMAMPRIRMPTHNHAAAQASVWRPHRDLCALSTVAQAADSCEYRASPPRASVVEAHTQTSFDAPLALSQDATSGHVSPSGGSSPVVDAHAEIQEPSARALVAVDAVPNLSPLTGEPRPTEHGIVPATHRYFHHAHAHPLGHPLAHVPLRPPAPMHIPQQLTRDSAPRPAVRVMPKTVAPATALVDAGHSPARTLAQAAAPVSLRAAAPSTPETTQPTSASAPSGTVAGDTVPSATMSLRTSDIVCARACVSSLLHGTRAHAVRKRRCLPLGACSQPVPPSQTADALAAVTCMAPGSACQPQPSQPVNLSASSLAHALPIGARAAADSLVLPSSQTRVRVPPPPARASVSAVSPSTLTRASAEKVAPPPRVLAPPNSDAVSSRAVLERVPSASSIAVTTDTLTATALPPSSGAVVLDISDSDSDNDGDSSSSGGHSNNPVSAPNPMASTTTTSDSAPSPSPATTTTPGTAALPSAQQCATLPPSAAFWASLGFPDWRDVTCACPDVTGVHVSYSLVSEVGVLQYVNQTLAVHDRLTRFRS